MSAEELISNRRVLIIGADGLRPDLVDPKLMPTYARLMARGTMFSRFYAAYPPHTRVSMATLTTGTYPGHHGVVNNLMYIPDFSEDGLLQTGNDRHLLEYRRIKGEPFLLRPTLGDRLYAHGKRLTVAASSSPGASLLWNLNHPVNVVNPASDYGEPALNTLHKRLGTVSPEQSRVKRERALWATRALVEEHLPDPDNRVMVLWLSEPDAAQHDYGLGSPEAKEAMSTVDECVAIVLDTVERLGLDGKLDLFLISDHGHSTIQNCGSLQEHVLQACNELDIHARFVTVGHHLYAAPGEAPEREELRMLTEWLLKQEWCGGLFAGRSDLSDLPGVLPIETIIGPVEHDRAPLLSVSPKWSEATNAYGVPGMAVKLVAPSSLQSDHGIASPFDLRAFCLAYGPDFKEGYVSDIASGIVDIAPTVCHLLGLHKETGFDGRVLSEGLREWNELTVKIDDIVEPFCAPSHTAVRLARVNNTTYLCGTDGDLSQRFLCCSE